MSELNIDEDKLKNFEAAYTRALTESINDDPEKYAYGVDKVDSVVSRISDTISKIGIRAITITNSPGLTRAAKYLGIKNTYGEWEKYFSSE